MSRHHEHLNFPAETSGAFRSGFYREARVFIHALFVPDNQQKVSGCHHPCPRRSPNFLLFITSAFVWLKCCFEQLSCINHPAIRLEVDQKILS